MIDQKVMLLDNRIVRIGCAVISGLLLGFSFPPSPVYSLAFVAFIPFFFLLATCSSIYKFAGYSYIFLFTFHLITVYWTGGFTVGKDQWMMIAGVAVLILHPVFFLPTILLSFFVKQKLGITTGLIAFILFWISFEYLHSYSEYSFPWLTIGNSQAYDLARIQILEYLSIYGMSLLILLFNLFAFLLLWRFMEGRWKFYSLKDSLSIGILVLLYFLPIIYGKIILKGELFNGERKIVAGVFQPNFDPWEKWGENYVEKWGSYINQLNTYITETKKMAISKPDLVIWPETAIPFHILLPRHLIYRSSLLALADTLRIGIYTGLPTVEYFESTNAPATAQRIENSDIYIESYNSTILIQPDQRLGPIHRKTILVPFAERIPYAESFRFLIEPLKWNVGISSWGMGSDTLINELDLRDGSKVKFSGMICYESVYPNYVREFVRRGAEFLLILTNDSWCGNTSGAYQHASFVSLRAVETRRWIVQCANGGISCIVDPYGVTHITTELYTKKSFIGSIYSRSDQTCYVRYGDLVGKCCTGISVMILLFTFAWKGFLERRWNGNNRFAK